MAYITWTGKVNVTESAGSKLVKTGGSDGVWDAWAHSVESVSSGVIKAEATIETAFRDQGIIGITNAADAVTSPGYADGDFMIFPFSDGNLYRVENGGVSGIGTYTVGDVVSVDVDGSGNVNYRKNGTILYTRTGPTLNYPLCVAAVFEHSGFGLAECKVTPVTGLIHISAIRGRALTAHADVFHGMTARNLHRPRTMTAHGGRALHVAATLTRPRHVSAVGRLNNEPNRFGAFTSQRIRELSTAGGSHIGGAVAHFPRPRNLTVGTHVKKANVDDLNILLTITPETPPGHGNQYSARIYADGVGYAIKAYQYHEDAGALGVELQIQLVRPADRFEIEAAEDFTFDIYDGVNGWIPMFDSGAITGLDYSFAFGDGRPNDALSVSTNGDLDNKLRLSPPVNTTIYDGERLQLKPSDFLPLYDTDRNAYIQELVNWFGLDINHLFDYVFVDKLGFSGVQTTIPNYPIRRADFNLTGTWFDGVGPHIGFFTPLTFVRDNVIWVIDSTAPFPPGFGSPIALNASDYLNAQFQESRLDIDGYIVEFADVETAYDYTENRFETDDPVENGIFGQRNWTETTVSRSYIDYFKFTDPLTPVRSDKTKEIHAIVGMVGFFPPVPATLSTETETINYDSFGRITSILKELVGLVPNISDPDYKPENKTIESAHTEFMYGPDRFNPVRQILKKTIKNTDCLVSVDPVNLHLGQPFVQKFSEGHAAGNLAPGLTLEIRPAETKTETIEQTPHGQFEMRTKTVNFLTDPPQTINTTTDARSGDMSLNASTGSTGQVIVMRPGVARTGANLGTLSVAELPLEHAKALALRKLERRTLRRGTITLKGLKLAIGRGTMFELFDRDGFSVGTFVCQGRSIAGSNLGTAGQQTRQTIEVSEI